MREREIREDMREREKREKMRDDEERDERERRLSPLAERKTIEREREKKESGLNTPLPPPSPPRGKSPM